MTASQSLIVLYVLFSWLLVLHTFEEIAQGVFELKFGKIQVSKRKYLLAASLITTLNLSTLMLIVLDSVVGLYLGLFTSGFFGIMQALVHSVGFFKEKRQARGLGVGFYSSIPLALVAGLLLNQILKAL